MEYLQWPHNRHVPRSDRRPEMRRGECRETCAPHCACSSTPPSQLIVELSFSCLFFPLTLLLRKSHRKFPKSFSVVRTSLSLAVTLRKEVRCSSRGQTPNGLSAGAILPDRRTQCQYYFLGDRRRVNRADFVYLSVSWSPTRLGMNGCEIKRYG
jgi:hypothetical protein